MTKGKARLLCRAFVRSFMRCFAATVPGDEKDRPWRVFHASARDRK